MGETRKVVLQVSCQVWLCSQRLTFSVNIPWMTMQLSFSRLKQKLRTSPTVSLLPMRSEVRWVCQQHPRSWYGFSGLLKDILEPRGRLEPSPSGWREISQPAYSRLNPNKFNISAQGGKKKKKKHSNLTRQPAPPSIQTCLHTKETECVSVCV